MESESGKQCASEIPDLRTDESGNIILIQKGITRDRFKGTANYSITATNDEKIGETAQHEYSRTITAIKSDLTDSTLPYYKISEQGSFWEYPMKPRRYRLEKSREAEVWTSSKCMEKSK